MREEGICMNSPLPIVISPESSEPLYIQIREQLRALIVGGDLPDGTLLPSLRELASELCCSLVTVRRVYTDLEREKLLTVRKGIGTFVRFENGCFDREWSSFQVSRALEGAVQMARMYRITSEEMTNILHQLLYCD